MSDVTRSFIQEISKLNTEIARLRAERNEAQVLLASATDLANTYAREHGVTEAERVGDIRTPIQEVAWAKVRSEESLRSSRAALADALREAVRLMSESTYIDSDSIALAECIARGEALLPPAPEPEEES